MHVVSRRTLKEFWRRHQDAENRLRAWYADVKQAKWRTPSDVTAVYATASILADNRVVFNIGGNEYRLVVKIHYNRGFVYIRFVGTHEEYDRIDATTI